MFKGAIGWSVADLKGISPTICMHRINLEDDAKPIKQMQHRLNLHMKESYLERGSQTFRYRYYLPYF